MAGFVHLHNHSEYSLLDGIAKIADIVRRCQELGFDSYALTDHGVMYGALEFYCAMRAAGLKPLVGNEVYVARRRLTDKDPAMDRKPWHCVLLAQNEEGYRNLMRLTSIAHTQGYYYKPRVDFEAIAEHNAGIVCLSACPVGIVAGPFHHDSEAAANAAIEKYLGIFGPERFFLEIQYHKQEMEDRFRQWAKGAAGRHGVRLVATNDCHYVHAEDARAHDIALCLRDKKLLTDTDRLRYSGPEYYIKSEAEMAELFADYPEAITNTRAVADLCNLELDLESVHFPKFEIPVSVGADGVRPSPVGTPLAVSARELSPLPDGPGLAPAIDDESLASCADGASPVPTEDDYLRSLTYAGAEKRYGEVTDELKQRIEYELSVIIPKGFTTYFLICSEFCRWAREHDIPVGPGRGSAAGSVVAYCLEITDLEPIRYDLYFERFLNPERIELPDFDIDFCMRGRDQVIEHVKQTYGADRVALLITFMRMKARAVIKSVARTKGLEFQYVDRVTKEIHGMDPSIDEAIERSSTLRELIKNDPQIAELIEDAKRLEGIAAHHSVHAAGLVIAPGPLADYVPVQTHKDSDQLVTQYAMDMIPKTGLVKFDFLGLRNLTMIEDTARYIRGMGGRENFDARSIPEDDAPTYAMLQRGDAYGVFQFEAPQVRKMLLDGRPENVIDLAAINAANRPGPLQSGGTAQYLEARKAGKQSQARFASIAQILESTGGVLLFQEQVLEIARQLAGYSLGEADVLRKAMGKKKLDVMLKQHERFMQGTAERGIPAAEAEAIWDMMAKFAEYGFNKAHSVCYSWISYQTAFLKCNYPHFYMCAMLNGYMGHSEKLAQVLAQCRKMKIPVLPPSVNEGEAAFVPTPKGEIIFGLAGIKGLGEAAVQAIVTERGAHGSFRTLADFGQRMKGKGINKKVLQALAMAGALDGLGAERVELIRHLDDLESFMRGPDMQITLFGVEERAAPSLVSMEIRPYDIAMLEKQAVGLFLTYHPFADHPMYSDSRHFQLAELEESVSANAALWQDRVLPSKGLVGLLTSVITRTANTSNRTYAKGRLEDPERSLSVVIWPKAYEEARELVCENQPVVLYGKVQLPESSDEVADAWDSIEVVVDRVTAYETPAGWQQPPAPRAVGPTGTGTEGETNVAAAGATTEFEDYEVSRDAALPFMPEVEDGATDLAVHALLHNPDAFRSIVAPCITWEVDLARAERSALAALARELKLARGDAEVKLQLRDVSGQIQELLGSQRYFTSRGDAQRIVESFPFITQR